MRAAPSYIGTTTQRILWLFSYDDDDEFHRCRNRRKLPPNKARLRRFPLLYSPRPRAVLTQTRVTLRHVRARTPLLKTLRGSYTVIIIWRVCIFSGNAWVQFKWRYFVHYNTPRPAAAANVVHYYNCIFASITTQRAPASITSFHVITYTDSFMSSKYNTYYNIILRYTFLYTNH